MRVPSGCWCEGVRHAFLLAGVLALVAAIGAADLVAAWVSRPVRRIASTAERIDAGESIIASVRRDLALTSAGSPMRLTTCSIGFRTPLPANAHLWPMRRTSYARP